MPARRDTGREPDRRVRRTEASLRDALGALIREKPYEAIAVKEILHRANVGRSTFYSRFSDKDDLLRSCIVGVLGARRPGDLAWFSLPILQHIEQHRGSAGPTLAARPRLMHEHLQDAICELIERDADASRSASGDSGAPAPASLVARWVASTFVVVLEWWVEGGCAISASVADRVFRRLIAASPVMD